jgi:hypothetical protein
LGVLSTCPAAATTEVEDVDGAPWGVLPAWPALATTKVEDVYGVLPGGAVGMSGSGHHRSPSEIHEVPELKVWEHPPST